VKRRPKTNQLSIHNHLKESDLYGPLGEVLVDDILTGLQILRKITWTNCLVVHPCVHDGNDPRYLNQISARRRGGRGRGGKEGASCPLTVGFRNKDDFLPEDDSGEEVEMVIVMTGRQDSLTDGRS
jgi:hypothetical protein